VQLRTLLTAAMVAVVGLTVAVVILATKQTQSPDAITATPAGASAAAAPGTRHDGAPEEDTQPLTAPAAPGSRYDDGPDEGSRGPGH
jgi:uncharacterized iron-regulated membrane protein